MKLKKFLLLPCLYFITTGFVFSSIGFSSLALSNTTSATTNSPLVSANASTSGTVVVTATMNSGGYTYIEYTESDAKKWLAGPETSVKIGDSIKFTGATPMANFKSKTLNKTFDSILFVSSISTNNPDKKSDLEPTSSKEKAATDQPIKVSKAKNGYTVEECFLKKDKLSGKKVTVKGKIVKLNKGIMGKTWIHIQDGTGQKESNDLTVTTKLDQVGNLGDIITVKGNLTKDKDLGSGYFFKVILEDAKLVK